MIGWVLLLIYREIAIQLPYEKDGLFLKWEQPFINASGVPPNFLQMSDKTWNVLGSMKKILMTQLPSAKKDSICADNTD